jgi:hypothetical protein
MSKRELIDTGTDKRRDSDANPRRGEGDKSDR